MTDKELNSIGQWLNSKGYDLGLTDCFWMEDWIANETKFRDIAELLLDYHKEQLLIHSVSKRLTLKEIEFMLDKKIKYMCDCVQDSQGTIDPSEDIRDIEISRKIIREMFNVC